MFWKIVKLCLSFEILKIPIHAELTDTPHIVSIILSSICIRSNGGGTFTNKQTNMYLRSPQIVKP